jgi:hypothetical protein
METLRKRFEEQEERHERHETKPTPKPHHQNKTQAEPKTSLGKMLGNIKIEE